MYSLRENSVRYIAKIKTSYLSIGYASCTLRVVSHTFQLPNTLFTLFNPLLHTIHEQRHSSCNAPPRYIWPAAVQQKRECGCDSRGRQCDRVREEKGKRRGMEGVGGREYRVKDFTVGRQQVQTEIKMKNDM